MRVISLYLISALVARMLALIIMTSCHKYLVYIYLVMNNEYINIPYNALKQIAYIPLLIYNLCYLVLALVSQISSVNQQVIVVEFVFNWRQRMMLGQNY